MAGADKDSKTEKATGKRVSEEFKKGNFAQAQEFGVTLSLLAGLFVILMHGRQLTLSVFNITTSIFGNLGGWDVTIDGMQYWALRGITALGRLSAPFLVAGVVAALISGGVQSKFRLTLKVLGLKWEKLNPVTGAKRLISKDTFIRFGIDLLKMAAIGFVMFLAVRKIIADPIFNGPIDFKHIGVFIVDTLVYVLIRLVILIGTIAAISYFYQKHKTAEDMKMTKDEVKQENKDQDMSPEVKKARMQMAMRLMQGQMLDDVQNADVIVTNPTHYAVALKYERGLDDAPMVIAKGENAFAQRIKDEGKKFDVPIVENKMVARMLFKFGRVGEAIPMEMYQSVAEILAFVYKAHRYYFHQLKARRASRKTI